MMETWKTEKVKKTRQMRRQKRPTHHTRVLSVSRDRILQYRFWILLMTSTIFSPPRYDSAINHLQLFLCTWKDMFLVHMRLKMVPFRKSCHICLAGHEGDFDDLPAGRTFGCQ